MTKALSLSKMLSQEHKTAPFTTDTQCLTPTEFSGKEWRNANVNWFWTELSSLYSGKPDTKPHEQIEWPSASTSAIASPTTLSAKSKTSSTFSTGFILKFITESFHYLPKFFTY